jgi:hypothetical protein
MFLMTKTIYIKLLDEGTEVYRSVSAVEKTEGVYEILLPDNYDSKDEIWEFLPGSKVIVEEKILEEVSVLVATQIV